jgi:hypothetical protein
MLIDYCTITKPIRLPSELQGAIVGNEFKQNMIKMWVKNSPRSQALMISGQIGCGKTSAIVAALEVLNVQVLRFEFDSLNPNSMLQQIRKGSSECVVYVQNAQCICLKEYKHMYYKFIKALQLNPNTICEFDYDCELLLKTSKTKFQLIEFAPLMTKTLQKYGWTNSDVRNQKILQQHQLQSCDQPIQSEKKLMHDIITGRATSSTIET